MSEKKLINKRVTKPQNNIFFKKTLIQSGISAILLIIMLLSVKMGGKNSDFNIQVKKYLNESTDVKEATRNVYNKARQVIDDEIMPVFNNLSIKND